MRSSTELHTVLLLALLLASLCVAPIRAQKNPEPSPPKYDAHTELKTKGIVEEVKLPPKGSEKEIAHLLLKNSTETVDVYLCPKSFLDDMVSVSARETKSASLAQKLSRAKPTSSSPAKS